MKPLARKLLEFFFENPTKEFAYREIERNSGVSIGSVSRYIEALQKDGFVKTKKAANSIFARANRDNTLFMQMKKSHNLESLHSSGLVQHLMEKLRPDALVIFGSYSRGEDDEESDIDIASIHGRNSNLNLAEFEKNLKRKISITKIKSIKDAPKEFRNTLANGIVLAGSIEVV